MDEAQIRHQKRLAEWDAQFLNETGIDLRPKPAKTVRGDWTELEAPGLRALFQQSQMGNQLGGLGAAGLQNAAGLMGQLGGQMQNLPTVPGYESYSQMLMGTLSREHYLSWYNQMVQNQMNGQRSVDLSLIQQLLGRRS